MIHSSYSEPLDKGYIQKTQVSARNTTLFSGGNFYDKVKQSWQLMK